MVSVVVLVPSLPSQGLCVEAASVSGRLLRIAAAKDNSEFLFVFFCGEGPRSSSYGRTSALKLIVQTCHEDER